MVVNTTDAVVDCPFARGGDRRPAIAGLVLAAVLLAGCGDPTRPLITRSGDPAPPSGQAALTGPDGFPNVNVNPVDVPRQPMPPADVTRIEDNLQGAGQVVQASGRAASAVPSQVGTLEKIGARHAADAAAAIEAGSAAATGTAPAASP